MAIPAKKLMDTLNLEVQKKSAFLGTERRKIAMSTILQICRENCLPLCEEKKLLCIISYKTGLTVRKIDEDYISVLMAVGILQKNKFDIELGAEEKNV